MDKNTLLRILSNYNISSVSVYEEIDSSKGDDYRLNVIVDKKYVLRVNNPVITEERLESIERLCGRYRDIGVLAPHLFKNIYGKYLTPYENHVCYISEYLDYQLEKEVSDNFDHTQVRQEVLKSIGRLSKKYSDIDLSPINSMWSLIDLAPLDIEVDEKQENFNMLVSKLKRLGKFRLAKKAIAFNEEKRKRIKSVYKNLPRCVIQGDLNDSNILVHENHFVGLIDFNMAGTEVNINHFCAETNGFMEKEDFKSKSAADFFDQWILKQNEEPNIILSEYEMNVLEQSVIEDYRSICLISQYSNVMDYLYFLKHDKAKTLELLELILSR